MDKKMKPTQNISIIGFADLHAMYTFLKNETTIAGPNAKNTILNRILDIERELYHRTFGFNPHDGDKIQIEGKVPETIDLNKF